MNSSRDAVQIVVVRLELSVELAHVQHQLLMLSFTSTYRTVTLCC
jgi:hypothetical protein